MSELDLQDKIKDLLENRLIPELPFAGAEKIKVYKQDLPLSFDYEDDDEDDKYFPCCIIKFKNGEIKTASDPQITIIEIIVCIKDFKDDMSGYRKTVQVLTAIRDYLISNVGIRKKYRMIYPIKIDMNDEVAAPYFMGNVTTLWQTDVKSYVDYEKFL